MGSPRCYFTAWSLLPTASFNGAIAQLGERVLCKHEVVGSIPSGSTKPGRGKRRRNLFQVRKSEERSDATSVSFGRRHRRSFEWEGRPMRSTRGLSFVD